MTLRWNRWWILTLLMIGSVLAQAQDRHVPSGLLACDKFRCVSYRAASQVGLVVPQYPLPYSDTLRIFVEDTRKAIRLTNIRDAIELVFTRRDSSYTLTRNGRKLLTGCHRLTVLAAHRMDFMVMGLFGFLYYYQKEKGQDFSHCGGPMHAIERITPNGTILSIDTGLQDFRNVHHTIWSFPPEELLEDWSYSFVLHSGDRTHIGESYRYILFKREEDLLCECLDGRK